MSANTHAAGAVIRSVITILVFLLASTQSFAEVRTGANALLAIDQNRASVIDRIIAQWGESLARSNANVDKEQLRTILEGLRADHLLAASLAGDIDGLRNVIANALTSTAEVNPKLIQPKSLGDSADDLVYTPVVPCRIVDTRNVGGAFAGGGETRSYHAYLTSGTFATQGGNATNCGIPANPAAAVLNITTVGGGGFLTAWAFNSAQPTASTLNPNSGIVANGAVVPLCQPNCSFQFSVHTFAAQVIVDIVGYFKPPGLPVTTLAGLGCDTGSLDKPDGRVVVSPADQTTGAISLSCISGSTNPVLTVNSGPGPEICVEIFGCHFYAHYSVQQVDAGGTPVANGFSCSPPPDPILGGSSTGVTETCGTTQRFAAGTVVHLAVSNIIDNESPSWVGCDSVASGICTFTLNAARTVTVNMVP